MVPHCADLKGIGHRSEGEHPVALLQSKGAQLGRTVRKGHTYMFICSILRLSEISEAIGDIEHEAMVGHGGVALDRADLSANLEGLLRKTSIQQFVCQLRAASPQTSCGFSANLDYKIGVCVCVCVCVCWGEGSNYSANSGPSVVFTRLYFRC